MPAVKISNLSKSFNSFQAVNELSIEVEKNKVFGFLGPNGAGKTTTIRMMVGLSKPDSGEIEISGKSIRFAGYKNFNVFGYLSEQPSFYNWMTGLEYLSFIADLFNLKVEAKKKRIEFLLRKVDLEEAKNRKIGNYSGGMRQRLGIAQALINEPDVLILDEPVSALDPIGRREVLEIIEKLKKNKTIFMSTHILADVDRICDDVAIINKGKLVIQSPLAELKARYATPILDIAFDRDPECLLPILSSENWVKKLEKNGNKLRIWLQDENVLKTNIPIKKISQYEPGILNYGLNLPEVEDLFVELIKD